MFGCSEVAVCDMFPLMARLVGGGCFRYVLCVCVCVCLPYVCAWLWGHWFGMGWVEVKVMGVWLGWLHGRTAARDLGN